MERPEFFRSVEVAMRATFSIAGVAVLTLFGCSGETAPETRPFMPMGDDRAEVNVYGFEPPSVRDGVEYPLSATACISRPGHIDCGRRKAAEGEFRPDAFAAETGGERKPMTCYPWVDDPKSPITYLTCKSLFERYETDQEVRVIVNEHEDTIVTMPAMPKTISRRKAWT